MDLYDKIMEEIDGLPQVVTEQNEGELLKKKKDELVEMCSELSLDTSGTKADLVDRLLNYTSEFVTVEAKSALKFVSKDKEKESAVIGKAKRV